MLILSLAYLPIMGESEVMTGAVRGAIIGGGIGAVIGVLSYLLRRKS